MITGVTKRIAIICPYCGHTVSKNEVDREDIKIFTNKFPVRIVIKILCGYDKNFAI
jgi:hypothetical protein